MSSVSSPYMLTLNRSDADSDVLADYVIALLKHDDNQENVRKLCEKEIPDFLTEGPSFPPFHSFTTSRADTDSCSCRS